MGVVIGWIALIIAIIGFEFYWWRKLREDMDEMAVMGLGWVVAGAYLVGGVVGMVNQRLGVGNVLGWWNPALFSPIWGLIVAQIVIVWASWIKGWKVWSVGEEVLVGLYSLTAALQLGQLISGSGKWRELALTGVAIGLFYYFKYNYRKWVWYKSGKKGFVFMAVNALYLGAVAGIWAAGAEGLVEMVKVAVLPVMSLILIVGLVMLSR